MHGKGRDAFSTLQKESTLSYRVHQHVPDVPAEPGERRTPDDTRTRSMQVRNAFGDVIVGALRTFFKRNLSYLFAPGQRPRRHRKML